MRFLITGASGWIGFELTRVLSQRYGRDALQLLLLPEPQHALEAARSDALQEQGMNIIKHDLLDAEIPVDCVEPFDVLIHLAAYTQTENESDAVQVNDVGTNNLLNALGERLRGKQVIYSGSITSVDSFSSPPIGVDEGAPCSPMTSYGVTKLRGEQAVRMLADRFGFDWAILRLPTIYGPGYRPGGLFDLIQRKHLCTRVNWPGSLSLLFITDLTDLLVRLCEESLARNELLHVACPTPVRYTKLFPKQKRLSLHPACWRVMRSVGLFFVRRVRKPHILFISVWRLCHLLGDSMVFDTTKAQKMIPMQYTSLQEGLLKTWAEKQ
jgi:UDP-glucose 4-epimerase